MFEFKENYDFKFYNIFSSFFVFIIFSFIYSDFWVNFVLAIMVYVFLRISYFLWQILKRILGFWGNGKGI